MAIPTSSGLTTANLDQATDNPSQARSDIALVIQKVRELLESVDKAGGIVKLDDDAQLEIARLFKTGADLKLQKVQGQGSVLSHTNTPETAVDVKAASGEAIKRIKIDAAGHIVRVERGDITSLTGPFYSEWYYSRYDQVSRKSLGSRRPSNYNPDLLDWIPGLSKSLPSLEDYLQSLGAGKIIGTKFEEAVANVENVRFSTTEAPSIGSTITTYYELTIKPYRARYSYYNIELS